MDSHIYSHLRVYLKCSNWLHLTFAMYQGCVLCPVMAMLSFLAYKFSYSSVGSLETSSNYDDDTVKGTAKKLSSSA